MRHLLASTGGVDKPIVLLGAEVFAGAVCYVLAATLIARTTSLDLVARVADAVRARA
jgi:hypothetical protein